MSDFRNNCVNSRNNSVARRNNFVNRQLWGRMHSRWSNLVGTLLLTSFTGFVCGEVSVREVGEQRVASYSVAVNRKTSTGKQQTLWVRVNAWSRLAEVAVKYIRKSSLIQCEAAWLRPSAWVDQNCEFQRNLRIARDSNIT
jgi:hypothetical protein